MKSTSITILLAFLLSFNNIFATIDSPKDLGFASQADLAEFTKQLALYRYVYEYTERVANWNGQPADPAGMRSTAERLINDNKSYFSTLSSFVENLRNQGQTHVISSIINNFDSKKNAGLTDASRDLGKASIYLGRLNKPIFAQSFIKTITERVAAANGNDPDGNFIGLKQFREKYQFVLDNVENPNNPDSFHP